MPYRQNLSEKFSWGKEKEGREREKEKEAKTCLPLLKNSERKIVGGGGACLLKGPCASACRARVLGAPLQGAGPRCAWMLSMVAHAINSNTQEAEAEGVL